MQFNEIWLGNCLELMDRIPDGAVDMICADVPYQQTACHWDSMIPLEPMWAQFKRVIKPNGAIVMTADDPFSTVLKMSNWDWYKYRWVWDKQGTANFAIAKNQPLRATEDVLIFGNGAVKYYPQMRQGETRKKGGGGNCEINGMSRTHSVNGLYYPTNVIRISNANFPERGLHPTQKPTKLFEYLIKTYTNPGDLVLDPTAGSGTAAIAAIETGRRWLCIEKDAGYYEIAKQRIEERLKQPFLPGIVESKPAAEQPSLFQSAS